MIHQDTYLIGNPPKKLTPQESTPVFVCVLSVIKRHESDRCVIVADPHRGHVTLENLLREGGGVSPDSIFEVRQWKVL